MKQYIITISDAEYLELISEHYRLKPVERLTEEKIHTAYQLGCKQTLRPQDVRLVTDFANAIQDRLLGVEK